MCSSSSLGIYDTQLYYWWKHFINIVFGFLRDSKPWMRSKWNLAYEALSRGGEVRHDGNVAPYNIFILSDCVVRRCLGGPETLPDVCFHNIIKWLVIFAVLTLALTVQKLCCLSLSQDNGTKFLIVVLRTVFSRCNSHTINSFKVPDV